MSTVLIVIHLMLALGLVGVVLMQKSEGGGLGIGGSSSSGGGFGGLMSGRAAGDLLTRTTAILATLFMLSSLTLAVLASQGSDPALAPSILDEPVTEEQAPLLPSVPLNN